MVVLALLVHAIASISNESYGESYVDGWGVKRKLIVDGTEVTDIQQFPWMVHAGGNCGGTIVSDKFVLTAYHCLNFDAIRLGSTIYAGSVDKKEDIPDSHKRKVVQIFANADIPYYDDSGMGGDAVLLMVDPPWEFDAQVQAIPITPIEPRGAIQVAISTGWGRTVGDEKSSKSNDLYAVKLVLRPCPRGTAFDIFCLVSERPQGGVTCQGDSGGPVIGVLQGKPYLIGVVSAGTVEPGLECKGLALMINLHRWSYWLAHFIPKTKKGPGPPPARKPPKNWGTSSRMSDDTFLLIFGGWGCIFLLLLGYFCPCTRAPNPPGEMYRGMMNPYPQKPGARNSEMRLHHMHGKMSAQQKSSHTSRRPVWIPTLKRFHGSSAAKKSRKSRSKSHDQTKRRKSHDQTKRRKTLSSHDQTKRRKTISSHDQTKRRKSHDQTKRKSLSSHDQTKRRKSHDQTKSLTKRKSLSSHGQTKRRKSHAQTKSLTKRKTLGSHDQTKKKNPSSHDKTKKITRTKSVPCRGKSSNSECLALKGRK